MQASSNLVPLLLQASSHLVPLLLQAASHLVPFLLQASSHLVPLLLQESSLHFLVFLLKLFYFTLNHNIDVVETGLYIDSGFFLAEWCELMVHRPVQMSWYHSLVIIIFVSASTDSRFITTHDFEAERGVCFGQCKQMARSTASDGMTVLIRLGDELHHTMEIKSNCSVSVGNVRYSTDGPFTDTVNISLANTEVGYFNSTSRKGEGHLWNVFKDSGPVGQHLMLQSGSYDLVLFLSVDDLGVEIDKTSLNFNCDGNPGEIESIDPTTTDTTGTTDGSLSVGAIIGIVAAVAPLLGAMGTIGGVVITAIAVCLKYRRQQRRQNDNFSLSIIQ